jgi:LacI family transcriptional regulator, galactose operon repressor
VAATSHDVARLAGVSQPTVSRALRDQKGVSAATRGRVREAARSLGYVPSQAGRALSTRRTRKIGVISAELSNPFYPALIGPLHDALAGHGYRTVLFTDRGERPVELEPLLDGSLDGVVLTTSETTSSLPGELMARGVPFVMVNRTVDGVAADRCVAGNRVGATAVAELLADLGHRRVAAILGPESTSTGQERAEGFRDALAHRGIDLPPARMVRGPFDPDTGRRGLIRLMSTQTPPTAVFCGNDVIALGALNAAVSLGIDIPDRLTVVGFDDIPMAAWEAFDLTTVRVDLSQMARSVTDLLLKRLATPDAPARSIVLEPRLVMRGTHAPPAS